MNTEPPAVYTQAEMNEAVHRAYVLGHAAGRDEAYIEVYYGAWTLDTF